MAERTEFADQVRRATADSPRAPENSLVIPEGYALVNMEALAETPARQRARLETQSSASFVTYVSRYGTHRSLVYAAFLRNDMTGTVTAVLDYHGDDGSAQWGEHIARLEFQLSESFKAWHARNKRMSPQRDFMEFLEDRSRDIAYPDAADLMEAIRQFRVQGDVRVTQVQSLSTGDVQFQYERTFRGQSSTGVAAVPEMLQLSVPVFRGCEPAPITARLRWNLDKDGNLTMGYSIPGLGELIEVEYEAQIESLTRELSHYYVVRAESAGVLIPELLAAVAPSLTAED